MKLTKFQHACFTVEHEGHTVIVDPGTYTHDFIMPRNVTAVIITHEHPDHLDETLVRTILKTHPKATLIAHESISGRFTDHATIAAHPTQPVSVGSFALQFFGGAHADIAPSITPPPNLGVLINDTIYYPGDSFVTPDEHAVQVLALPASAPWLKISQSMEFLATIRPQFAFPTHDAILSLEGKQLVDRMLGTVAAGQDTTYKRLDGQSIELQL